MPDEVGRERAQMEAVVADLRDVLDPIFEKADIGYAVIAFGKLPPGFGHYTSNVSVERLAEVLLEMGGRLRDGDQPLVAGASGGRSEL